MKLVAALGKVAATLPQADASASQDLRVKRVTHLVPMGILDKTVRTYVNVAHIRYVIQFLAHAIAQLDIMGSSANIHARLAFTDETVACRKNCC